MCDWVYLNTQHREDGADGETNSEEDDAVNVPNFSLRLVTNMLLHLLDDVKTS